MLEFVSTQIVVPVFALVQVLFIDLVLAGDNAVVVGMVVAGLAPAQRHRAVVIGIVFAAVLRIGLASVAMQLLDVIGLMLAGGLLLLWVGWRMYREMRPQHEATMSLPRSTKTLGTAVLQIVLADLSMSLDNILAVAGAAQGRPGILIVGLAASVAMMAFAATLIGKLLDRYRWLAWLGLAVVLFVACKLIWEGSHDVARHLPTSLNTVIGEM